MNQSKALFAEIFFRGTPVIADSAATFPAASPMETESPITL